MKERGENTSQAREGAHLTRIKALLHLIIHVAAMLLPPQLSLRFLLILARVRVACGVAGNWPPRFLAVHVSDRKAGWQRRTQAWAYNFWFMYCAPRLQGEELRRHVTVSGLEHVRAARESGHGVILVGAHQAGIHAVPWVLDSARLPWYWFAEKPGVAEISRPMRHKRVYHGLFGAQTLLYADPTGIRRVYTSLKQGSVVYMTADLPGTRYDVQLLGRKFKLALGAVRIAQKTGAHLVPTGVQVRLAGGLHIWFGAPTAPGGSEDELAGRVAKLLGDVILSAPELWYPPLSPVD